MCYIVYTEYTDFQSRKCWFVGETVLKKSQKNRAAGQSVLKAQRLLSNSRIGCEAYTESFDSV